MSSQVLLFSFYLYYCRPEFEKHWLEVKEEIEGLLVIQNAVDKIFPPSVPDFDQVDDDNY